MTVLDTSVMVALLKGKKETIEKINEFTDNNDRISITIFTVYELLKGAYLSSNQEENLSDIRQAISSLEVLDLSPEACVEASRTYSELKTAGKLIGEIDILISAIAKTNGEAILTYDQHFKVVQGLNIVKW